MRLLHVPQEYFSHLIRQEDLEKACFSFKCFVCKSIVKVTVTDVDDCIYCKCNHEYRCTDFFDDEQVFSLRLASTSELVELLRLVRLTFNAQKRDRIARKIGELVGIDGDWRAVLSHVDKNYRTEVEQSKNRKNLRFIF